MKTFNKAVIAVSIITSFSALAMNTEAVSSIGKTTNATAINLKQLPQEVQSGSIVTQSLLTSTPTIKAIEAIRIASQSIPGKVMSAELDNENGFLIWEVVVQTEKGQQTELKLDAGNGNLLAIDLDDNETEDQDNSSTERDDEKHSIWKFWENDDHEEEDDHD